MHSVTAQVQETNPPPPFTTSTLQQAASRQLDLTPAQTDRAAQQLYEAGLVTYIRTDAVHVAPEAHAAAQDVIRGHYGLDYLPEQRVVYQARPGAQRAHEAIRPTHPEHLVPDEVEAALDQVTLDLYTLIWRRFVASEMAPARHRVIEAQVRARPDQANPLPYPFLARARLMLFPGYQAVYEETPEPDESGDEEPLLNLPALAEGDGLRLEDLKARQGQTRPPQRYSAARLVAELERLGVGRPSTYSATIATLLERGYAALKGRHVVPTSLGEQALDLLLVYFPQVFDLHFTATMESLLDHIAQGNVDRKSVLSAFWSGTLSPAIEAAQSATRQGRQLGQTCPRCGQPLEWRSGRRGPFAGCSAYPGCTYTQALPDSKPVAEVMPQ